MSVALFEVEELAEVALAAVGGSTASTTGREQLEWYSAALAELSACNAAAFADTYCEPTVGVTKEQILDAANDPRIIISMRRSRAAGRARGLQYNCTANDGTDHLTDQAARKLIGILCQFIG